MFLSDFPVYHLATVYFNIDPSIYSIKFCTDHFQKVLVHSKILFGT